MRILASPAFANQRTNPYNAALYFAVNDHGVTVEELSKKRLFLESWDILHIHWPDGALNARNAFAATARTFYLIAKIVYAKSRGAKVIWTVHNLKAHNGAYPRVERLLWKIFVPLVDGIISLSRAGLEMALERFPALASKEQFVVPHGHYRGCYKHDSTQTQARAKLGLNGRQPVIGFVGQIKPYKNVPGLMRAFLGELEKSATLLIAGKPVDGALAVELRTLAEKHSSIVSQLAHIPDDDMQLYLSACDLAVFPYREILNSGSAILALSFDRPVLVPAKGAMAELRDTIGSEWVMTYDGELTGEVLRDALYWALNMPRPSRCDLSPLEWETIAKKTLAAYETVLGSKTAFGSLVPKEGAQ